LLWLWLLLIAFIILFAIFVSSNISGEFYFSRAQNNDQLVVEAKALFGLIRFRFEVPIIKFKNFAEGILIKAEAVNKTNSALVGKEKQHITKDQIIDFYHKGKLLLQNTLNMYGWMKETLCRVQCTKFIWTTRVGIGDAPETAITAGIVWGIKSSLAGFILQYFSLRTKPRLSVIPQYNQPQFIMELSFAGKIRVYHAIWAAFRLFSKIIKVKGGVRAWYQVIFKSKFKPVT
jgi:hypothetical protein